MRLAESVVFTETEYGIVLLDERKDEYFNLNPTAALVLQVLLEGGDRDEAASRLSQEFTVARTDASHDVDDLVRRLRSEGLITS
ncbi:coenzyme PQQ synthesis protein D (PqqD) [Murinocardiopsis flavida]|uniref:Coenzyme PQQ synthesis protein D (PqqD) n=1 Tax=Murinocardiopsis flavida TaxID=645275 RepID=A0A2P8CF30_9ACTN|nr:lasso peptide biosynthesis PqqD family chaperone [Murinocardiopsis flavida]PSK83552.1 coenzyme PQQ synthesis protein D (PqqD) [Murinocardiopsis flavida]